MDLTKLSVNLRPRNPWEGIDLGFALARRWFLPLWMIWWLGALPVFLLLILLPLPLWLVGLLSWWCKPLYEPPLLYWLGRVVFTEQPSLAEVRRRWWSIVRNQLLANLTWRRLSTSRSFVMPVAVLEDLRGKERQARIRVISRQQHAAGWLTVVGIHFELILELGLLTLLVIMLPDELRSFELMPLLFEPRGWQEWLQQVTGLLAMSVIAPFYVAGGFGLYLTRRSQLEAWDIELGFRNLVQRLKSLRRAAAVMFAVGLTFGVSILQPSPLQAAELNRTEAKALIQSVMLEDDFGQREIQTTWKYIGDTTAEEDELPWLVEWLLDILQGFLRGFAGVGELLLWLALGGAVVYLIHWFVHNRSLLAVGTREQNRRKELPQAMLGLDIRPESLPDDIAAEALRLVRQGQQRAALSLLYRGSLSALVHRHQLEIPAGATEGECLELARPVIGQARFSYLRRLTRAWRELAYGHQVLDTVLTEQLCLDWRRDYGE